jgi:hypothetical protein
LVGLSRSELDHQIANHPDVECLDTMPEPAHQHTARRFQAWPVADGWILRPSVAAFDAPDAPIVDIALTPSRRGTRLRGRFLRFPAVEQADRIRDSAFLAIPVAVVTFEAILLGAPALAFVMPVVCVFMYLGVASNRVRRRAMQRHGPALWSLVGELFAQHALPEAEEDDPFRGEQHALG